MISSKTFRAMLLLATVPILTLLALSLLFSARADEPTAAEKEKFQQLLAALPEDERQKAEANLAALPPADRDQFIHRYVLAAPAMQTEMKRKLAIRALEDLRLLDAATDQYAIETDKTSGTHPAFADLKLYLKAGTTLYNTGADPFNHVYGPFTVDSIPKVSPETFNALSDVADANFWSPYK